MKSFAQYFLVSWQAVSCIGHPFIPKSNNIPAAPASYIDASRPEIQNNLEFYQQANFGKYHWITNAHITEQRIELLNKLGCGMKGLMLLITGPNGTTGGCRSETPPMQMVFPPELQVAPVVREFLSQNNSIFLFEFWNSTSKRRFQQRTINLTYEDATKSGDSASNGSPDMGPQNGPFVSASPKTTSVDPAIVSRWNKHTSNLEQSRVEATLEARDHLATLAPRQVSTVQRAGSSKTSTPTKTKIFSTMPSERLAAIWARHAPEQFGLAQTSTGPQVSLPTPISYSTLLVETTTLRVLVEGDPVPTITSYILSPVYSSSATATTQVAAAATQVAAREVVICLVAISVVLLEGM